MEGIIAIILVICFIGLVISHNQSKPEIIKQHSPETISMLERIDRFFIEIKGLKGDYFSKNNEQYIINSYRDVYKYFSGNSFKEPKIVEFKNTYSNLQDRVKEWNREYVERTIAQNKPLFDNIDGKSLDEQQRRAVVVDEINNLVLAGAGSGKTLTISGKVKFLVDIKKVNPQEILLISFTRKAAEEMQLRISNKLNIGIEAMTFHKLGLQIITHAHGKRPDVAEESILPKIINEYFESHLKYNKKQVENLIHFFSYFLNIPKDLSEFDTLGDNYDHYKDIDLETLKGKMSQVAENLKNHNKETLKGETVRSLEEVMIANYLFLHGINYEYEELYPYESTDKYRKAYRPDFYLKDYNIYLEHFGISKDNRAPWLSPIEEKKYLDGIQWKRSFHKENGTVLLETYSYYNSEGRLLVELEKKLIAAKVQFQSVDYYDIYQKIFDRKKDKYWSEFTKLISSFINLFKSNGYGFDAFNDLKQEIHKKMPNAFLIQRSLLFLSIVEPIFQRYQMALQQSGQIDFNDMINIATEQVHQGKVDYKYRYIIIDEYQDISVSRFNLIKEIKQRTNAKLMCVGDDWQSIYRFAGSDINLFTDFEKHLGYYELLKIERTYRNSQELINMAGKFVMKNTKQLKKNLISGKHHSRPIRVKGYDQDLIEVVKTTLDEIATNYGYDSTVTILGRNNFDIDNLIGQETDFKKRNMSNGDVIINYSRQPKLNINFLSVHKSKGLEADNIIVLNLKNALLGFPNKISDDPILSLVLTDIDSFEFAEERRLFYVALTRTKNSVYLMTSKHIPSAFVQEIMKDFNLDIEVLGDSIYIPKSPKCPKCQKGSLLVRESKVGNSEFLGCSNFPACDYTLNDIEIVNNQIKCFSCGGYMTKRKGTYGEFYGCTNYPYCRNTLETEKI